MLRKEAAVKMPSKKQVARVILRGLGENPDRILSESGNQVKDASHRQVKAWMRKNLLG